MKLLILFISLFTISATAQTIQYKPNRKLDKTVAKTYYNTEFIFLKNISPEIQSLTFEVIENTLLSEWSSTICTNQQCFNTIPNSGALGNTDPNNEAYISVNLSANGVVGSGQVRFLIRSGNDKDLSDTITFKYTVNEDGKVTAQPWANINFNQGVVTVLRNDISAPATMRIFDASGRKIVNAQLGAITSFPLRNYEKGVYIIIISDEKGRVIKRKVTHYL